MPHVSKRFYIMFSCIFFSWKFFFIIFLFYSKLNLQFTTFAKFSLRLFHFLLASICSASCSTTLSAPECMLQYCYFYCCCVILLSSRLGVADFRFLLSTLIADYCIHFVFMLLFGIFCALVSNNSQSRLSVMHTKTIALLTFSNDFLQ